MNPHTRTHRHTLYIYNKKNIHLIQTTFDLTLLLTPETTQTQNNDTNQHDNFIHF